MPLTHKTLSSARTRVRQHIDESTANYWSDSVGEINNCINDAKDLLVLFILTNKKDFFVSPPTSLTLTAGVSPPIYTLPEDFFRLKTIRVTTSGQEDIVFRRRDRANQTFQDLLNPAINIQPPDEILYDIITTAGLASELQPLTYPVSKLLVAPIIRSTLVCEIQYHQVIPALSSDSDTFGILDPYVTFIEFMAASIALSKGPSGDWKLWKDKAEALYPVIKASLQNRELQGPQFVEEFMGGY